MELQVKYIGQKLRTASLGGAVAEASTFTDAACDATGCNAFCKNRIKLRIFPNKLHLGSHAGDHLRQQIVRPRGRESKRRPIDRENGRNNAISHAKPLNIHYLVHGVSAGHRARIGLCFWYSCRLLRCCRLFFRRLTCFLLNKHLLQGFKLRFQSFRLCRFQQKILDVNLRTFSWENLSRPLAFADQLLRERASSQPANSDRWLTAMQNEWNEQPIAITSQLNDIRPILSQTMIYGLHPNIYFDPASVIG